MTRTSVTHPLQIASVSAGSGCGRVGITFCPGKLDPHAMTGQWDRDELIFLRVERLGQEVLRRELLWFHLPIVDGWTPDNGFERRWEAAGKELRTLLRSGRNILVHCRGGSGRAGTIGARLLIELGMKPATAIEQVRAVRPGAIETHEQEKYVLGIGVHSS